MDRRREDRRVWQGCGARLRAISLILATIAAWLGCGAVASAATKTWTGGNASWLDGANWSPAGVPGATDRAVVTSGSPEISTGDATVGSLDLQSPLTVSGGRTLTVAGNAASTIAAGVTLTGNLRLNGATTWSAGRISIVDAGLIEPAGTLTVTAPDAGIDGFDGAGANGRDGAARAHRRHHDGARPARRRRRDRERRHAARAGRRHR